MLIKDYMSSDVITVTPEDNVGKAFDLMREHSIRRLPVMKNDRLVGIVSKQDLMRVSPSPSTSLSVWEINYLYPRLKIKEAMSEDVLTTSPDTALGQAALTLQENAISTLPVMEDGKLVGIITESDIFKAFVDVFGFKHSDLRLNLEVEDKVGVLAQIVKVISEMNINIMSTVVRELENNKARIILYLDTDDMERVKAALKERELGIINYE